MTICKKADLEKEIYDALQAKFEGCYYSVEVTSYREDDCCMSDIEVSVNLTINGGIEDLPSGYLQGNPESDYVMSILTAKKKMNWKEFDKVQKELCAKGYRVGHKEYYEGELVTEEIRWEIPPKDFIYEIVSADRYY